MVDDDEHDILMTSHGTAKVKVKKPPEKKSAFFVLKTGGRALAPRPFGELVPRIIYLMGWTDGRTRYSHRSQSTETNSELPEFHLF
jgi:hypothetical protein